MRKLILLLLFPFLINAQSKNEIINPKGKWYFGAEIGTNTISSFSLGEPNQSFQGGVLAEYYFARHWSLSARIKYFETGVSFYDAGTNGSSGYIFSYSGRESYYGNFKGAEIAIPLNIKWEFRISENLGGSLKIGAAYTIETKSEYGSYSKDLPTNYPTRYESDNLGYGFNYFINKKMAFYLDFEYFIGNSKGYGHYSENKLTNIGTKYNFKK